MWWICIPLSVIAMAAALLTFAVSPSGRRHPDRQLLTNAYIAHRGLHDLRPGAPENSPAAFSEAIIRGYTIETDIRLTSDGEVVVFHDDTLGRMCGCEGKVCEKTLAELKELKLAGTDERIPTLRELLTLVDGKVPLMIEFKAGDAKTCDALCAAADGILSGYEGKYYIQSFHPFVLKWYKKNRPQICRGQLSCKMEDRKFSMVMLENLMFDFLAKPDFISYQAADKKNIFRRLTAVLGAHQICWTLRSQKELDEARADFKTYIFEGFIPED